MPVAFLLLATAFVAMWSAEAKRAGSSIQILWQFTLVASCLAAWAEGLVAWQGLALAGALWASCHRFHCAQSRRLRAAWADAALILATALATHRMPGFSAYTIAQDIRLSASSAPMTLDADFDKGFAGLLLVAYFCRRAGTPAEWRRAIGAGLGVGIATSALVIGLAVGANAVRLDPKLPAITPAWMAVNLALTCVFEEALFRGVLQHRLAGLLVARPRWSWVPLAVASVLFGLVHAGGGPLLIVLATIAGAGYGLAYALTGRIEAAVVAHFTLNALHFVGFTYPYAVR